MMTRRGVLLGIPLGLGAFMSRRLWWKDTPMASSPAAAAGPVEGFRIDVADAVVQSLSLDTTAQSATVTFSVPVSDVELTFGKTRLVRRPD